VSNSGIPDVSLLNWMLAFSPIAVLLVLMVGFNWGGAKAGAAGWLVAFAVSVLTFGSGSTLLAYSQVKAALLSVWVLYIIWAALMLFHIVDEAGSIKTIGEGITRITSNKVMQLILLAWIFTTFLQGVAGYGIPVAVVAPLMVGMGFSPVVAVVTTSIGHSWSVTFGSLAASFFSLAGVAEMPGSEIAIESGLLLGAACFLCGFGAVWAFGGLRAMRQGVVPLLLIGTLMAGTQLGMASLGTYPLAAFTAGCVGLVAITGLARLPFFLKQPSLGSNGEYDLSEVTPPLSVVPFREVLLAFSAYLILVVIVLSASFIAPLTNLLNAGAIRLSIPETMTDFGWTNSATESYRTIAPFGEAGALLVYASVIGYLVYRRAGKLGPGAYRRVISRTVTSALTSSIGIVAMVGMALIMTDSGMTFMLARGMVDVAGPIFPFLSPFIGVLGAFMTGSNTNSNILFGALQRDSAILLGLPPAVLLAAQTTGGALGSMIAPAKIIVGCSTVGLAGKEGPVVRAGARYGIVITSVIGVLVLVWSWLA
jgi:lactate permease